MDTYGHLLYYTHNKPQLRQKFKRLKSVKIWSSSEFSFFIVCVYMCISECKCVCGGQSWVSFSVFSPDLKTIYSLCVQRAWGRARTKEHDMASEDNIGNPSTLSSMCVLRLGGEYLYQLSHPPASEISFFKTHFTACIMVPARSSRVCEDESEEPEIVPSQPGLRNEILPGKPK